MQQLPLGVRLADRALLESFLAGPNGQALEHAQRIADRRSGGTSWYCGPHGVGKSHLLQAICARAGADARAAYLPLRELQTLGEGVLEGLTQLDCLSIDDVDAVSGRGSWEHALFDLHREMEERGGRLVLAAQAPPALLPWVLPDLGSRCAAAAVFQLRALDESQRRQALQLRARTRGVELPDETARWLQRRFPRDMHSLYGLLDELDEAALIAQRRLTIPFIRSVLKE